MYVTALVCSSRFNKTIVHKIAIQTTAHIDADMIIYSTHLRYSEVLFNLFNVNVCLSYFGFGSYYLWGIIISSDHTNNIVGIFPAFTGPTLSPG